MKVTVNFDTCMNMGQCVYEAPTVFSQDESGNLHFVADVDDSLRDDVESAAALCPTQSISIE